MREQQLRRVYKVGTSGVLVMFSLVVVCSFYNSSMSCAFMICSLLCESYISLESLLKNRRPKMGMYINITESLHCTAEIIQ